MQSKHPAKPEGYVYVMGSEANSLVKIGWAKNPERRRSDLQMGSPVELEVLRTYPDPDHRLEFWLHEQFPVQRRHGEWFALGNQLYKIDRAVREYELRQMAPAEADKCRRAEDRLLRHLRKRTLTSG